jgi:hypothetical protein
MINNRLGILTCLLLCGLFSERALASSQYSTRITQITSITRANYTYITVDTGTGRTAIPSCASGNPNLWYIENTDANVYKNQISILLMALAQGKTINIIGSGDCQFGGTGPVYSAEMIQYIFITP